MEPLIFPIIALVSAWILGALFTKAFIPFMEKKQFRQFVREEGPKSHLKKTGTPSMGGLAIISAVIISSLAVSAAAGKMNTEIIGVQPQAEGADTAGIFSGIRRIRHVLLRRKHDERHGDLDTGV